MNVAVVGFGMEGQAALRYWRELGATVTVCDQNTEVTVPSGIATQLGENYLANLDHFDVIVRSAGINPAIILDKNPDVASKITTIINEFLRVCPTKNVIGVTGTKGKGTTSTLITKMLEAAGKQMFLGGNIGKAPMDFLKELTPESWVVLELSSFQLIDIQHSPHIGLCLMVEPEHLNWHLDLEDYTRSKSQLFAHQNEHDIAIYFADSELSHAIASVSPGAKLTYYAPPGAYVEDGNIMIDTKVLCKTDELKLLGKHNWQNACAAATAVWQVTQDEHAIRRVLTTFEGLEHRLEFVRKVNGVNYYNDSFASAPPAAEAAMEAIPGKKVLILGGFERHLALDKLVKTIAEHQTEIEYLLLIGASAERIASELQATEVRNYRVSTAKTMQEVVEQARALAKPGDSVVLSPGFASFDMFKNFEDRGTQYKKIVQAL